MYMLSDIRILTALSIKIRNQTIQDGCAIGFWAEYVNCIWISS